MIKPVARGKDAETRFHCGSRSAAEIMKNYEELPCMGIRARGLLYYFFAFASRFIDKSRTIMRGFALYYITHDTRTAESFKLTH